MPLSPLLMWTKLLALILKFAEEIMINKNTGQTACIFILVPHLRNYQA